MLPTRERPLKLRIAFSLKRFRSGFFKFSLLRLPFADNTSELQHITNCSHQIQLQEHIPLINMLSPYSPDQYAISSRLAFYKCLQKYKMEMAYNDIEEREKLKGSSSFFLMKHMFKQDKPTFQVEFSF